RLDLVLLTAPGLIVETLRSLRTPDAGSGLAGPSLRTADVASALALGAVPLILWHLFALAYYGFPFPNTAYAKLGTGIPSAELMAQGLRYLSESFRADPVTLLTIAAAALASVWRPTRQTAA